MPSQGSARAPAADADRAGRAAPRPSSSRVEAARPRAAVSRLRGAVEAARGRPPPRRAGPRCGRCPSTLALRHSTRSAVDVARSPAPRSRATAPAAASAGSRTRAARPAARRRFDRELDLHRRRPCPSVPSSSRRSRISASGKRPCLRIGAKVTSAHARARDAVVDGVVLRRVGRGDGGQRAVGLGDLERRSAVSAHARPRLRRRAARAPRTRAASCRSTSADRRELRPGAAGSAGRSAGSCPPPPPCGRGPAPRRRCRPRP